MGDDSCFESHATQPRATLIDCCTGGFMHWRQGGDSAQMPNHMENLTIWNFYATNAQTDQTSIQKVNLPGGIVTAFGGNLCLLSLSVSTEVL